MITECAKCRVWVTKELLSNYTAADDKWHGLRASSEQRRKGLEDMVSDLRDLREHEEQLMRWLGQKDRMLDVLGPVAMEPAMLASQLEQVKVRSRTCT